MDCAIIQHRLNIHERREQKITVSFVEVMPMLDHHGVFHIFILGPQDFVITIDSYGI